MVNKQILLLLLTIAVAIQGSFGQDFQEILLSEDSSKLYSASVTTSGKSALWKSALLPGWGEYEFQKPVRGKIFILTEGSLWLVFAECLIFAKSTERQFQSFAALHAAVELHAKSDQYFVDIGNHESMESYNQLRQRYRNPDEVYPGGMGYEWQWDNSTSRQKFRSLRVQRDRLLKISRFTLGAIVVNHAISFFDVLYLKRTSPAESRLTESGRDRSENHGARNNANTDEKNRWIIRSSFDFDKNEIQVKFTAMF